ncbi:MAG: putative Fe-S oxidoreductase [Deltaproteobacteria bacterium]|nr:putative Fe-S oxidoreductase [Deltaproteobacteria bacterium]
MTETTTRSRKSFEPLSLSSPPLKKISLRRGIIYGPVPSRRLGQSLGINLLPTDDKLCSFNCLYCQYGWTKNVAFAPVERLKNLPSVDAVAAALENALTVLGHDHKTIDGITICGNGEPTLYPALAEVIVAANKLRDRYQPQARVAILSNSSTVGSPAVRAALELLDLKIMKFDAGSEAMFRQLNHPAAPVYMGEIIAGLKQLKDCYLQSCFVQGRVTNADPDSVAMWVEKVREIHPLAVHIYSLDRAPADKRIERVSLTTLQWIANEVRWRGGVRAEVF